MKALFLILFIIYVLELPTIKAKILPRASRHTKRIQNFNQGALETRGRNLFENINIRKANTRSNVPVYIITKSKAIPISRTGVETPEDDDIFDENGMLYITQPKAPKADKKILEYLDFDGRRSYDLSKKNKRKLMAMMNKELNKQLLQKANTKRRNFEVDFTELVS
ncbi:uncharacterized protein LOC113492277 [Trichoplusia ni]|uniref:Uncharacterized protein LOC113492277 n=1 Tax=Trichoplusia ni TaxID=7111 RepID=A0A7E5VB55_TRINI|nr:uncharacterized protein LOC113492277 [Trichoplusia ni]